MNKIAIIGNGGGGKSSLAQALAQHHDLHWLEIDKIQFQPGWQPTPEVEVRAQIEQTLAQDRWIIDGFGPYNTIVKRFELADQIIFVDHPLWVHYWWAMERQIAAHLGEERLGGPKGCDLRDVNKRMCQALWHVHTEIRPKLLKDLKPHAAKTLRIESPEQMDEIMQSI